MKTVSSKWKSFVHLCTVETGAMIHQWDFAAQGRMNISAEKSGTNPKCVEAAPALTFNMPLV